MPDLKLGALLESLREGALTEPLARFYPADVTPDVDGTRLQPPICYWCTFEQEGRRVTFKSLFSEETFVSYRDSLIGYYPEQIDQPDHPRGGLVFLPELNGMLWSFPFDPLMPQLHRCVDGGWIAAMMGRRSPVIPEAFDYRPEVGAMLRYRDPLRRRVIAFGKATPRETCGLIYLVMQRLWDSDARRAGRLRLARPIAFRPECDFLLQTRVYGHALSGNRNRLVFARLCDAAGDALAAVHDADIPFGSRKGIETLIRRLTDLLDDFSLIAPFLYPDVKRLVDQLQRREAQTTPAAPVPSHGDYKYDQLLRYRQQFVLIDFELFCQAEPGLDLGTFCAYLPPSRPLGWQEVAAAETLRQRFLKRYAKARREPIDFDRLALWESAMLAIRASTLVTRQRQDWQTRSSQMIALALERLVAPEGVITDDGPSRHRTRARSARV